MPGGAGKPKRACAMCKFHKYMGNSKHALKHSVRKKMQED